MKCALVCLLKKKKKLDTISTRDEDLQQLILSTVGKTWGFLLAFWGKGPVLLWSSDTFALIKKAPAEYRRVGLV